jgi:catechol 2,3-dioxygenase-like lactoylglutathione lyase family enzyme
MPQLLGIDHVAITVQDLEATCAFYDRLFGAKTHNEYIRDGETIVRQILIGGAVLSVHQVGNNAEPVADRPTVGSADICFRWGGDLDSAIALLAEHDVAIVFGPGPRKTADGIPAQSIYFRDLDENLIELMAAN